MSTMFLEEEELAKLTGSNEAIAQQPILREFVSANIDKYNLQFDEDGNVNGDIRVKAFRSELEEVRSQALEPAAAPQR